MSTKPKSTALPKAITADIFGSTITLTFSNGESLELSYDALSVENKRYAALHGLKQKLCDAAAIGRDPDTGRSATIADKYDAVREVYDRLKSGGSWNKVREARSGTPTGGLLIRALMQMKGKTRGAVTAFVDSKSKEEIAALKKNPKVAAIINELQIAKLDIDTDSMLDELLDDESDSE